MRGGEAARLKELSAEQRELRCELEAVHSEQAWQLSQARQEQLELETRLEQLRQQACACESGVQHQQEAQYTEQVRKGGLSLHLRFIISQTFQYYAPIENRASVMCFPTFIFQII